MANKPKFKNNVKNCLTFKTIKQEFKFILILFELEIIKELKRLGFRAYY